MKSVILVISSLSNLIIKKKNCYQIFRSNIAERSAGGAQSLCMNMDHMTSKLGPLIMFGLSLFTFCLKPCKVFNHFLPFCADFRKRNTHMRLKIQNAHIYLKYLIITTNKYNI